MLLGYLSVYSYLKTKKYMAKSKIINSNPKRTISFSNFNRLDKGLKIAIGLKWSKLIINDVA